MPDVDLRSQLKALEQRVERVEEGQRRQEIGHAETREMARVASELLLRMETRESRADDERAKLTSEINENHRIVMQEINSVQTSVSNSNRAALGTGIVLALTAAGSLFMVILQMVSNG